MKILIFTLYFSYIEILIFSIDGFTFFILKSSSPETPQGELLEDKYHVERVPSAIYHRALHEKGVIYH